ncbi:uncharacterized protein F5147DRAFT_781519 [Suillus discolor]|uniref:Uncharacterized protein n=1 Tax=Suillus discolor TaxID=1912936 RepID=A0A9P7JM02_9AGAM|nr:uncharacterized protein F5147DRAFT_781519 [Suillus discolor]KAG2086822.1 hypothetical protein F5147DRAFT_781519 [Suillus discolor]
MSDHNSASDSESNKQPPANEEEIAVLQSYLEQWRSAASSERKNILRAATMEARTKAPVMSIVLSKARKVTYETWFRNHAKAKKPGKPPIKMGQKWTERSVIDTLRKKELLRKIEDETGAKPGTKEMMNHYTVHLNRLMASLSPEDLEEAKETADKWNSQGIPDNVKVEIARKKGDGMIRHFASEMWNCARIRVFVLSAWKDGESKVQVSGHDYNQEFGGAKSFMKTQNWKVIEPEWDAYAASVFKGDVEENTVARKRGRQDNTYSLDIGDDGYPVIPAYESMDLDTKKAVIWAFLTWHYRKCCGDPKVSVPWKYVIPRYNKIIPVQYLPDGHDLAEPLKLRQVHATELLQFWHSRQEEGKEHVFEFIGWWDNDSEDIVLATERDGRVTSRAQPITQMKKPSGSKSKQPGYHRQSTAGHTSGKKMKDNEPTAARRSGVKVVKSASSSTPQNKSEKSKNKLKSSEEDIHYTGTAADGSSAEPSEDSDDDMPPPRKGRQLEGRNLHTGSQTHGYHVALMSSNDSESEVEQDVPQKAIAASGKHARKDMAANIKARTPNISSTGSRALVSREKEAVKHNAKVTARDRSKSRVAEVVIPPVRLVGPASQAGQAAPANQANVNHEASASNRTATHAMPMARHLTGGEHARKEGRKCPAEETLEESPVKQTRS